MNAKTELIGRLLGSFSGGDAITEETLADLLKGYTITRESDETRSDLHRRIKYYLGAKKIDGLSERTLKNYKANLESFAAKVEKLRAASQARVAADPEYSAFRKKLEMYNKYKDKKSVSLNEEVRWKEYKEEKQLQDEAEKIYLDRTADGKKKNSDPVLDEAVNIASDFAALK